MNFFLTLLVVVIVFNILYHLLKGLPSLLTWFYIKIATLWLCVRGIVYLIRRSRKEEEEQGKTKELTRRPPPYLLRRYAHQWMKKLESDQGWAWCLYVARVPSYYRDCSLEDAYSLPLWVEQTISFVTRFSLQLLVIYILMLILMPQPMESTPTKLYDHLGIEVASCLLNEEGLCFLLPHEESVGVEKLLGMARRPSSPPINKTTTTTLDLLVGGREQRLLYPLEFLGGIVQYVSVENELIPLLMHLDKEERKATGTKKHPCICPLFLNMPGNLSFLYDTSQQEWVVMIRPAIYRNNSFAELVLSSVNYNAQSLFFSSPYHISDELIHYDSFVVEYTDSVQEMAPAKNLEEASLFTKVSSLDRKQMHIFGDDAVCFVYCDTIKKK